jgi:hypothetical protein
VSPKSCSISAAVHCRLRRLIFASSRCWFQVRFHQRSIPNFAFFSFRILFKIGKCGSFVDLWFEIAAHGARDAAPQSVVAQPGDFFGRTAVAALGIGDLAIARILWGVQNSPLKIRFGSFQSQIS